MYGIPTWIHSNQGWCFNNKIMKHLYAMYGVEQPTTMPYNLCSNSYCEKCNHTLIDLLKSLSKEQKSNWPLHLPSLIFMCNAMPHSTTGYQPHELCLDTKHLSSMMCGLGWLIIMNIICKASVNRSVISTNSSLGWIGAWKNQSPGGIWSSQYTNR